MLGKSNIILISLHLIVLVACGQRENEQSITPYEEEINKTQSDPPSKLENPQANVREQENESSQMNLDKITWSTYTNARFAYKIPYPSTWNISQEPTNGDGVELYNDGESTVLVYAAHYMPEFAPNLNHYEQIETQNGDIAYVLTGYTDVRFVNYSMVLIKNNLEYHLNAKVSGEFYEKYKDVLEQMVMNFETPKAEDDKKSTDWSYYENGRFGFRVMYPSSWPIGEEPTNGDGVQLYEDGVNEVIVYASNYFPEFAPDLEQYNGFMTNSGVPAYVKVTDDGYGNVVFDMVLIKDEVEYHIYGEMSREFYDQNIDVFEKMIRGFEVLQ